MTKILIENGRIIDPANAVDALSLIHISQGIVR